MGGVALLDSAGAPVLVAAVMPLVSGLLKLALLQAGSVSRRWIGARGDMVGMPVVPRMPVVP